MDIVKTHKTIYNKLCTSSFPSKRGKEILGIDLVFLDSTLMGIFSQHFSTSSNCFNINQLNLLKEVKIELKKILPHMNEEEYDYFSLWLSLIEKCDY